jgi:hypothetical protein
MTEPEDTVLAYWKEHREQLRQSENQRAVLTNYVLVIAAGVSGLVVQQHFGLGTLPLSVLIVIIGLYGALAAAKYHERADYHLSQARALTRILTGTGALPDSRDALQAARDSHAAKYPRIYRLRLNWLWTGLHLGIALYGLALIIVTAITH